MLTCIRRPMAAVLGAVMLDSTVAPTRALAAESRERAQTVTDTLEIFNARGTREFRFEGGYVTRRLVAEVEAARMLNPAILDSLRRLLVQFGAKSKRGMASVQLSLLVIDALASSTAAEFHARVQRLPIVLRRTPAEDSQGRPGIRTEYLLYGLVRATRFHLLDDRRSTEPRATGSPSILESDQPEPTESFPLSVAEDCEYNDGEYFYGECATQQDIDDAASAFVAMDAEAQGITNEVNQAVSDNCNGPHPNEMCWESTHHEQLSFGGPSSETQSGASCASKGYAFAGAGVGYIVAAAKLWGVIGAASPPAAAVGAALGAFGVAFFAVVGLGVAFKDCLAEQ
jgi:hypothetical protein